MASSTLEGTQTLSAKVQAVSAVPVAPAPSPSLVEGKAASPASHPDVASLELPHALALEAREWVERFNTIYEQAAGDVSRIPWAHRQPCPSLVAWLNAEAPSLIRCGGRVAVVGCGLGEDALLLRQRGYDVVAFDASRSAIESAQRLHPAEADMFVQADLLDLPARLKNRFDLVVEIHTLQALPPCFRSALASGMASLLSPRGGLLLAICRGRDPDIALDSVDGPPFALTAAELTWVMQDAGLHPVRPLDVYLDDNSPAVLRLRGAFRRH